MRSELVGVAIVLGCAGCGGPSVAPRAPTPEPRAAVSAPLAAPSASWTLVAGGVTACARALAGGAACWGSWSDAIPAGLDFDPHALRTLPVDVIEVAPGWTHTCVRTTEAVRCEGHFDVGAVVPTEPVELATATRIVSGRDFTCGIDAVGALVCLSARPHPNLSSLSTGPLRALAATTSGWQLCALGEGDMAWCWSSLDRPPVAVALPEGAEDLVLAADEACARDASGAVACWSVRVGAPPIARVIEGLHADAIAALPDRVCARDGSQWACIAAGADAAARVPWLEGASAIAGGLGFVCGAFADGVRCFGDDTYGQLGPFAAPSTPLAPPASFAPRVEATGATALALGRAHACFATADAHVACWGSNAAGQLGDRTGGARAAPRVVPGIAGVTELRAGDEHTCVRTAAHGGELRCWGTMLVDHGEDVDPVWRTFAAARVLARGVVAIASGADAACAVRASPSGLRCWGSTFAAPIGEWVALPEPAHAIATAPGSTCAIGASGAVWCVDAVSDTPTEAVAWRGADALVASDSMRCSIASGGVRCAGRNVRGELGDGTRTTRDLPVSVRGVEGAIGVAIGEAHACAVLGSGEVRCWGANESGQLGDGTREDRWRAVTVVGVEHAVEVAASASTSCARLVDGTATCWGAPLGELPDDEAVASPPLFP